jgi:hypothetical protein
MVWSYLSKRLSYYARLQFCHGLSALFATGLWNAAEYGAMKYKKEESVPVANDFPTLSPSSPSQGGPTTGHGSDTVKIRSK